MNQEVLQVVLDKLRPSLQLGPGEKVRTISDFRKVLYLSTVSVDLLRESILASVIGKPSVVGFCLDPDPLSGSSAQTNVDGAGSIRGLHPPKRVEGSPPGGAAHRRSDPPPTGHRRSDFVGSNPSSVAPSSVLERSGNLSADASNQFCSWTSAPSVHNMRINRKGSNIFAVLDPLQIPEPYDRIGNYIVEREIHHTEDSFVVLAHHDETGVHRVIKGISLGPQSMKLASNSDSVDEAKILKRCRHRHIISLFEILEDVEGHQLLLVMQYADKGSIGHVSRKSGLCERFNAMKLVRCARHIISALVYMHERGIYHCDIKPENILLDSKGNAYISDFGVSSLTAKATSQNTGTLWYRPPELFTESDARVVFNAGAADVWALGLTFYILLTGTHPLHAQHFIPFRERVLNNEIEYPTDQIPELVPWVPLLKRMLVKDPKERATILEARDVMMRCFDLEPVSPEAAPLEDHMESTMIRMPSAELPAISVVTRTTASRPSIRNEMSLVL